jgi:hypothetical protein
VCGVLSLTADTGYKSSSSNSEDQMPINPFAATGSPSITVPSTKQLIVETLSMQVDVTPPGTKLEAFLNYKSGGQNISLFVPLRYAYTDPSTHFDFHVAMQGVHR